MELKGPEMVQTQRTNSIEEECDEDSKVTILFHYLICTLSLSHRRVVLHLIWMHWWDAALRGPPANSCVWPWPRRRHVRPPSLSGHLGGAKESGPTAGLVS